MIGTKLLAAAGALGLVAFATPAFAHEYEHEQAHQQLDQIHGDQHQQLNDQENAWHARKEYQHERLHATGGGWGPRHWAWHMRERMQHRREHQRLEWEHADDHAADATEHDQYHREYAPNPYYRYRNR